MESTLEQLILALVRDPDVYSFKLEYSNRAGTKTTFKKEVEAIDD